MKKNRINASTLKYSIRTVSCITEVGSVKPSLLYKALETWGSSLQKLKFFNMFACVIERPLKQISCVRSYFKVGNTHRYFFVSLLIFYNTEEGQNTSLFLLTCNCYHRLYYLYFKGINSTLRTISFSILNYLIFLQGLNK